MGTLLYSIALVNLIDISIASGYLINVCKLDQRIQVELSPGSTFHYLRQILHQVQFIDSLDHDDWKFQTNEADFSGLEYMKDAPKFVQGCLNVSY